MSDAFLLGQKIGKKEGYLILSAYNIVLNYENPTATITITRPGDGKITAVSNDTSLATVTVSGTTLTINGGDDMWGDTTIIVSVAEGTNYTAPTYATIAVSARLLPVVGTALNDCSWNEISQISKEGFAGSYFEVGDRKAITINGTIGTLSVSDTYYAYIIGIDHNGAINTIDFGTFKTALSGGTDICLIDNYYNDADINGAKYFNMNHWGSYDYGGWKGCDARYDILGSTNVVPSDYGSRVSSGRTGYDATSTCTTNPVSNTLMAALPSELRTVMKPMTIYSNNTGGGSAAASSVTASVDYLPLLAEYEIFGSTTYAHKAEQNYQRQYVYYSSGNSKVKYQHSSTDSTVDWWERSPTQSSGQSFCAVDNDGSAWYRPLLYPQGLAPIFRI